jgi:hypothetical protein
VSADGVRDLEFAKTIDELARPGSRTSSTTSAAKFRRRGTTRASAEPPSLRELASGRSFASIAPVNRIYITGVLEHSG